MIILLSLFTCDTYIIVKKYINLLVFGENEKFYLFFTFAYYLFTNVSSFHYIFCRYNIIYSSINSGSIVWNEMWLELMPMDAYTTSGCSIFSIPIWKTKLQYICYTSFKCFLIQNTNVEFVIYAIKLQICIVFYK